MVRREFKCEGEKGGRRNDEAGGWEDKKERDCHI